jgi:hypothetical protein
MTIVLKNWYVPLIRSSCESLKHILMSIYAQNSLTGAAYTNCYKAIQVGVTPPPFLDSEYMDHGLKPSSCNYTTAYAGAYTEKKALSYTGVLSMEAEIGVATIVLYLLVFRPQICRFALRAMKGILFWHSILL